MENKFGLVFSGGGGKGAYQIGVWKALDELGVCGFIKSIAGASAGNLNSAMFCSGELDMAVRTWSEISEGSILAKNDMCKVHKTYHSWFSNNGLKEMVKKYVNLSAVKNSGHPRKPHFANVE